ncbi:hypothetical protein LXA43DRAFT_185874 [Ganoderma leucocontextum]|nr:hypothetical protein LXA43DRAFT_185874 [Ganoderma leucocontextum]
MELDVSNNESGFPSGSDSGLPRASPSVPFSVSPSESIVICPEPPYPPQPTFEAFRFPVTPAQSPRLAQTPSKSWSTISSSLLRRSLSPSPSSLSTAVSDDLNTAPSIRFRSSLLRRAFISRSPSLRSDQGDSPGRVTRSPSPSPLSARQQESPLVSPTSPRFATFSSSTLADTPTTGSGSGSGSSSNTRIHTAIAVSVDLPGVLGWLRDICFELWIDQEGFRRVQPKFRLAGYTPPSPFPDMFCDNELTHGIALFRPVRRETSIYHHGILDTLPALRRLTLADREDKDYISRQASLAIKENGVYVVTGLETFDDPPPSSPGSGLSQAATNFLHLGPDHTEPAKLRWRFEYMVEDRKSDSGRIVAGEKTFTPLSFSCSPGLLHPSHGKRIRLMQVLMKTMSPKLSSSKLTTTLTPYAGTEGPVGFVGSDVVGQAVDLPPLGRARNIIRTLSGHRRTRSSEPASIPWSPALHGSGNPERARPASLSGVGRQATVRAPSFAVRDRRDVDDFPPSASQRHVSPGRSRAGHGGTPGRVSRQILSREELAAILASFPAPGTTGDPGMMMSASSHASALSPPSYYRHRRAQSDVGQTDELGMVMSVS